MRCTIRALAVYNNKDFLISHLIKNSTIRTRASMRRPLALYSPICSHSRVKGWLNRNIRATRERLHSGRCFRAAGEKNLAVRWSRDLQPVAISNWNCLGSRGFYLKFSKLRRGEDPSSQNLTIDFKAKSVLVRMSKADHPQC